MLTTLSQTEGMRHSQHLQTGTIRTTEHLTKAMQVPPALLLRTLTSANSNFPHLSRQNAWHSACFVFCSSTLLIVRNCRSSCTRIMDRPSCTTMLTACSPAQFIMPVAPARAISTACRACVQVAHALFSNSRFTVKPDRCLQVVLGGQTRGASFSKRPAQQPRARTPQKRCRQCHAKLLVGYAFVSTERPAPRASPLSQSPEPVN
jgi:hypothetical protein